MYTTQVAMFEGLFVRALAVQPGSGFAADLRAAGLDLDALKPLYDIAVWTDCLDVAWRHVYPELSRDEAWVQLGRRFIEGYFHTVIGRMIAAALPFMTTERFVERVPWFLRTGLGGSTAEADVQAPGSATLMMHGPHARASLFLSGVLQVCFERLGTPGTFVASSLGGDDSRLEIRWAPQR